MWQNNLYKGQGKSKVDFAYVVSNKTYAKNVLKIF